MSMTESDFERPEPEFLDDIHHCPKCGWEGYPECTTSRDHIPFQDRLVEMFTVDEIFCGQCGSTDLVEGEVPEPNEPDDEPEFECAHCRDTGLRGFFDERTNQDVEDQPCEFCERGEEFH
jgi:transcription elongation factor Elf1